MNDIDKALIACEKVINGIEDEIISVDSALLQCTKIARLLNDEEALIWLQYEYEGYPRTEEGHVKPDAFKIAQKMGRGYFKGGKQYIFTALASELEKRITANQTAIGNFTTSGISVSGNFALASMQSLTQGVSSSTKILIEDIMYSQKKLSKLKAKYYEYALKKQIELTFSNVVSRVFDGYRKRIDNSFSGLSKECILKLKAIEGKIESDNPEMYSQALTTCRRLFESVSNELFDKCFPNYSEKKYKTKSGIEIDVSGDHYKNKLSASIEKLQDKSMSKTLVGSNILYLIDWIENLNNLQCKGVHEDISREDAEKCIIQTYICLGDILSLQGVLKTSEESPLEGVSR